MYVDVDGLVRLAENKYLGNKSKRAALFAQHGNLAYDGIAKTAANDYITVFKNVVLSRRILEPADGGLGTTAVDLLNTIAVTGAHAYIKNDSVEISAEFNFRANLHRNSLYSEGYPDGVSNIAALLNNGFVNRGRHHTKNTAFEIRYDLSEIPMPRYALSRRQPSSFVQESMFNFVALYGSRYKYVKFTPGADYKMF